MRTHITILLLIVATAIFATSCRRRAAADSPKQTTSVARSSSSNKDSGRKGREKGNNKPSTSNGVKVTNQKGQVYTGAEIFKKYNTAVFTIHSSAGQGSGFFINNNGLAVSNYHVFEGASEWHAKMPNSNKYDEIYDIVAENAQYDYVIFKVRKSNTNSIPLAKQKPQIGEKVYAIGSPLGLENTFSSGEVSQYREDYYIQISVPIDHGSSGGVLINEHGEAVGITSAGIDASGANLNFARSIELIKNELEVK